jgi:hypothetical protein
MPDKLYRYRGNLKWEKEFLTSGKLFVPFFSQLNDPIDGNTRIIYQDDLHATRLRLDQALLSKYPSMPIEERIDLMNRMLQGKSPIELESILNAISANEFRSEWGVLSLTIDAANEHLWKTYAAEHRGICLEFDGNDTYFKTAQQVTYQAARPIANYPASEGSFDKAMLIKTLEWSKEKEWRIINAHIMPQMQSISDTALTGIHFGASISTADKELVKGWADLGPFNPTFY